MMFRLHFENLRQFSIKAWIYFWGILSTALSVATYFLTVFFTFYVAFSAKRFLEGEWEQTVLASILAIFFMAMNILNRRL